MKANKSLVVSLILSAVAVVCSIFTLFYCLLQNNSVKPDEEIFNENINKVVEIRGSNDNSTWGYGTGCFIDINGLILTNRHMVYSEAQAKYYDVIQVRLPTENDFVDATVERVSETDDIATIKIAINSPSYFSLANGVSDGMEIYTLGNPKGFGLSFTKGNVSSKLRNVTYNGKTMQAMQTSLIVNEGNSGGPVFDKDGKLVGVVSFRLRDENADVIQGVSFCVPLHIIKTFINN